MLRTCFQNTTSTLITGNILNSMMSSEEKRMRKKQLVRMRETRIRLFVQIESLACGKSLIG